MAFGVRWYVYHTLPAAYDLWAVGFPLELDSKLPVVVWFILSNPYPKEKHVAAHFPLLNMVKLYISQLIN